MFQNLKDKISKTFQSSDGGDDEETQGMFDKVKKKITKFEVTEDNFDDIFEDLRLALLQNNVAIEVVEKIKQEMKNTLVGTRISRSNPEQSIKTALKKGIEEVIPKTEKDIIELTEEHKPLVVMFVGVNGSGKTTSLAKVAHRLQEHEKDVVMAAADTFRAAAIDQLEEHANNLNTKLIKHEYESDPAAVAYDAVQHAEKEEKDAVLIDTAGRLHNNENLMQELTKIKNVNDPDFTFFVGESVTGNDCVNQAKTFHEKIGINATILSKADLDDKGGAPLSVGYITKKPIMYLGTGQNYEDLTLFNKQDLIEDLGLNVESTE